jgi:hypothetical protein
MTIGAEQLEKARELGYIEGRRRTAINLMYYALKEQAGLGIEPCEATAVRLIAERQEALATLRNLCSMYGDNDWDDDLHLSDIIEKHLVRNIVRITKLK